MLSVQNLYPDPLVYADNEGWLSTGNANKMTSLFLCDFFSLPFCVRLCLCLNVPSRFLLSLVVCLVCDSFAVCFFAFPSRVTQSLLLKWTVLRGDHWAWKVMESHGIYEDHIPGLDSHGKQHRSWKILERHGKAMEK